ncbi:MAG: hypothetical protein LBM93_12255 [Oscillospiraceae bacterium]|jgi:hypothetical protein|nr:hypothetical protein [Oscillospiraceae bacterium]
MRKILKKLKFCPLVITVAVSLAVSTAISSFAVIGSAAYRGTYWSTDDSNAFITIASQASDCMFYRVPSDDDLGFFRGIPDAVTINISGETGLIAHFSSYRELTGYGSNYEMHSNVDEYLLSGFNIIWTPLANIDGYQIEENGHEFNYYK